MVSFFLSLLNPEDNGVTSTDYEIDVEQFTKTIEQNWTNVSVSNIVEACNGIYLAEWVFPQFEGVGGMIGKLNTDRKTVVFTRAPILQVVDFISWFRDYIPQEYDLYFFDDGLNFIERIPHNVSSEVIEEIVS